MARTRRRCRSQIEPELGYDAFSALKRKGPGAAQGVAASLAGAATARKTAAHGLFRRAQMPHAAPLLDGAVTVAWKQAKRQIVGNVRKVMGHIGRL